MSSRTVGTQLPAGLVRRRPPDVAGRRPGARALSTSALLWGSGVLVLVLLVSTCVACVVAATTRDDARTKIVSRLEPLNSDTATVYRALAGADAAVVRDIVASGTDTTARQNYDDDITAAAAGLSAAAARADDPGTADRVAFLSTQLPVYTGLVQQARGGPGQAQSNGKAYLDSASSLLNNSMLPVAASLQQRQARALSEEFDSTRSTPVFALVLAVVTVVALVAVQVAVARRFKRFLNAGLLVATVAMVLGLGWWTVSGAVSGEYLDTARTSGRAVAEALVPAQIAALQARTSEGTNLVLHTSDAQDHTFADKMEILARNDGAGGALGASKRLATDPATVAQIARAATASVAYRNAHAETDQALQDGRFDDAVRLATTRRYDGTSAQFDRLDVALTDAVTTERRAFADETRVAGAWRTWLVPGSVALALLVAAAACAGLWRGVEEYRNPARGLTDPFAGSS